MTNDDAWAIPVRAEALATLLLTEREDLEVLQPFLPPSVAGYDYLVRVIDGQSGKTAEFAVAVRGTRMSTEAGPRSSVDEGGLPRPRDVGLPFCLFVFDVGTREGWYRWLSEPVVDREHGRAVTARLVQPPMNGHTGSSPAPLKPVSGGYQWEGFQRLTGEALADIVEQVKRWSLVNKRVLAG